MSWIIEQSCFVDCGQPDCPCKTKTPKLTKAYIEQALKEIYKLDSQREIVAYTGCYTYGMISWTDYCDNPDCENCVNRRQQFYDNFKIEVEKQIKNSEDGDI